MFNSNLRRKQLDAMLAGRTLPPLKNGYISEIRHALGMTSSQLGKRVGVAASTIRDFEANERNGTITIATLEKCAAAMGCRLVYSLVPLSTLDDVVHEQALLRARELMQNVGRTMALEQQSTDASAQQAAVEELAEELLRQSGRQLWS